MKKGIVPIAVAMLMMAAWSPRSSADSVMDGVNVGANTAATYYWVATDVGWFYTPGISYSLTGIDTRFDASDGRTCTLEFFQGGPPSDSGTLLGSAAFVTATTPTWCGGTFAGPISLTAGSTYFVGFRNTGNLGVNVTADSGATVLSELRFDFDNLGSYGLSQSGDITNQPILRFRGESGDVVPEAGTLTALAGLLCGGGLLMLRRRK